MNTNDKIERSGVFLDKEIFRKIQSMMETKVSMDFRTGITITHPPDKEAIHKIIDDFAKEKGLTKSGYGLAVNRELIRFKDEEEKNDGM